jgi:hypothetical protein
LEAPWALDVAGDMVRETIKTKTLDLNEWPEDRITEAAKGLLDHFKAKKAKEHA